MKFYLIMVWYILAIVNTYAQDISGIVYEEFTKTPISGAIIKVENQNMVSLTDASGAFQIKSSKDSTNLFITALGYENQEFIVKTNHTVYIALKQNNSNLNEVVVTANREASLRSQTPIAISKLSAKLIDETKANQVFEIINKTPGVIMPSYNNEQHGMSIRQPMGTSAYYLYLEDGVPIRPLGVFNHNALLEVNQFAINSIEVVKGPVSSIYGPEAVGGAINFIMQKPTPIPTAKIGLQFDNWGFRRIQFGAGAQIKKFGFYIGGLSSKQTNSWMASSDYDKTSLNARLEYNFSNKTRLIGNFIYGTYYSQMAGNVDSTMFYSRNYVSTSDFTYRKSDAYRSRLTLEHDWNSHSKSFITLFQRNNKHGQNPSYAIRWNPVSSATNDPTKARGEINSNDFESYGFIAQHSQKFNLLNSKLLAGVVLDLTDNTYWSYLIDLNAQLDPSNSFVEKYSIARERPDIPIANYNGDIKNYAAYLQYDFEPVNKLRFSVGGRYDVMDLDYINNVNITSGNITYQRFTPKIGATYEIDKNKGVYANFSQGFSPPSLTAIFRPRPNTNPVEFYTNLSPAYFNNYELGGWISFLKNKFYLDVTAYQMDGRNELLNIRQPDNSFDFQSAGKTLHRGLEFGFNAKPTAEYWFRFGGTTAIHRFKDFKISDRPNDPFQNLAGFDMPSSPRWTWNSEFYYYPKWFKNFRTSVEWQYLSSWYQNQINTVKYEGYHLLNYRVGYKWKAIELYANIMNFTDELFANSATRGNNLTDRSTFNPGAPRTYVMGIQYNFTGKNKIN
ncbi:colicin I receptor [Pedobacter glucosidilyticus]|nr:TonB-dependent receptor [Pedobacter glucosidilyticus]KHJ37656.1 colicin I receptor [Pedobacter glucosidilyticus]